MMSLPLDSFAGIVLLLFPGLVKQQRMRGRT